jgi:hypothetical protein
MVVSSAAVVVVTMARPRIDGNCESGCGRRSKRRDRDHPGHDSHVSFPSYFAGTTSVAAQVSVFTNARFPLKSDANPSTHSRNTHQIVA